MKTPTQIVDTFWKTFGAHRFDELFRDLIAEQCELVMPGMPALRGHAPIRQMFEAYARAFPDLACTPLHTIESSDTHAGEARYSGTHRGSLTTPQGDLPPTGRSVSWESADVVRIADGKIVSWHIYHDPLELLAQLGVAVG
jgi:ketosteroid isomerase-like protein